MVKFGKLYRSIQIEEFTGYYIDYKKLKQKIKKIRETIPSTSTSFISNNSSFNNLKFNLNLSISNDEYIPNTSQLSITDNKYNQQMVDFKNLLDKEFQKFFKFFQKIKIQLHNKLNRHLYTQTNYSTYTEEEVLREINNLRVTIYLAKCLNAYINDNMMAIKKILKKFDKKFNIYFGNLGPKYILDNLCKENSDFEYILQFKIIDETCCIIEDNTKLLKEYYMEITAGKGRKIKREEDPFFIKYNEIWEFLLDIDELIYFKIQYKEWFYFIKKNAVMKKQSALFKNLMFNPILFSAYHKDDIMNKFFTRKDQLKEVENIQVQISISNQINIILILIQTFFYNTLISGIYPLQFIYINYYETFSEKNYKLDEYSFLIISSTYICSYFSIMIYHLFGSKRIKLAYILSNIFFFFGSLFYILSFNEQKNIKFFYAFLIVSRICIGFGANPLMGKKYILSYSPSYFLPKFSKIYVFISLLGHSMGPFFMFIFFATNKEDYTKIVGNIIFSKYNSLGWYGIFISIMLIFLDIFCFTSPTSKEFTKLKSKNKNLENHISEGRKTQFLNDDNDDTEDKEFYKLQKEMIDKIDNKSEDIINTEDNNIYINNTIKISNKKEHIKENNQNFPNSNNDNEINSIINTNNSIASNNSILLRKTLSYNAKKSISFDFNNENYNKNPLLIIKEEEKDDPNINMESENGNFVNINMIPRTIDDLKRKEKKAFSYLNKNLLIILIILFFCNLLRENFIAYSCYYILYKNQKDKSSALPIFLPQYLCISISISYFLEFFSMFFILPLYKINTKLKRMLVILLLLTIILIIPICFEILLIIYFILVSLIILISAIIEVLSSAFLAYLTPPDWKISHINAGSLPFYIMNFGKLLGCLICCSSLARNRFVPHINNLIVLIITCIGYIISGVFIFKSKNFRIKAICRIMRKAELDSFNFY